MRGDDKQSGALFSYLSLEERVPEGHPLRRIRSIVDAALEALSGEFEALYSHMGRPSIPPEKLLRALLLQAFYTVRSERQLMEQLDYNLLFRWFVGLGMEGAVWDPTVFSKNRDRLLQGEVAQKFLAAVLTQARVKTLLSSEHFSVDGTLIEAWAGHKSSSRRMGRRRKVAGQAGATPSAHSTASNAATTRMPRRRTRMRGSIGKATLKGPSSATWVIS
jgi:transposase